MCPQHPELECWLQHSPLNPAVWKFAGSYRYISQYSIILLAIKALVGFEYFLNTLFNNLYLEYLTLVVLINLISICIADSNGKKYIFLKQQITY